MDHTILLPSPNWFQTSGLAVSNDGWLVYGGPSKSLCVLEPLPADSNTVVCGNQGYKAHVSLRVHPEKIVCVDISPEWPEKKAILTGSADGTVKQWSLERTQSTMEMKSTHSHEIHYNEKEEVAGVGYCKDGYAVTVGCYGHIVKWDLNSNVVKTFNKVLNNFKPVCMACSPHIHLNVAIGTKQGVVFVLDLNGAARVLYKVRGQDDEILKVGWCPQYEVAVRKSLKESEKKSVATQRMEKIRAEPETPENMKLLDERVKKSCGEQLPEAIEPTTSTEQVEAETVTKVETEVKTEEQTAKINDSGIAKTLPEDSFDDTQVVQEDDIFDIYKEPEIDEFGHKKYQPVDIIVKIKDETPQEDFLGECNKLKDDILKLKTVPKPSIQSLVDAMDKTHVEEKKESPLKESSPIQNAAKVVVEGKITKGEVESSVHIHKHLLATVGKYGSVRIWSKSGKLVGSCAIPNANAGAANKNQRNPRNQPHWTTLLWYKSEVLLLVDGRSQLLECNPLKIDCRNKLEWSVLHTLHKRGLYTLASNAPRVQPPEMCTDKSHDDNWVVWTASQDRNLICYSVKKQKALGVYNTCGGFIYKIVPCPYDARKVAVTVGDGAVRVWESDTLDDDDTKISSGTVTNYWQNVQGKVLTAAWHPTKENCLAFATGEARVGVLDVSGRQERSARVLAPALSGGVYALSWGPDWALYACGGGQLVMYHANKPDEVPTTISVELEGKKLEISAVVSAPRGLLVGSSDGAVCLLAADPPHTVIAAAFVFTKMIHSIDWHPLQTSNNNEESPHKNLIAVCSLDKVNSIVILEYGEKEDGTKQLSTWKTLVGHSNTVLELAWNPHIDGLLLSTSSDATVRVWNVEAGACVSICGAHSGAALGGAWAPRPAHARTALSGGADAALRLWAIDDHPPDLYQPKPEPGKKDKKKKEKKEKKEKQEKQKDEDEKSSDEQEVAIMDSKIKACKKFLLPMLYKQTNACKPNGPRAMLRKYLEKVTNKTVEKSSETIEYDLDYLKLFGNINELNEVLDMELEWHQDTGSTDAWLVLCIFRGYIDAVIQHASQRDLLDPYLLSLAPCVSFKYWKDATQLYLAQIDRLVAKGEESKLNENRRYGGPIFRKTCTLLSLHDVKGALAVLCEAKLYMEAYVLCKVRYMESIAEEMLLLWGEYLASSGRHNMAAVCYVAHGNISLAASILGKSKDEETLSLAAEMAKLVGQTTFADHVEEKREMIKLQKETEKNNEKAEDSEPLPTRADLLMRDVQDEETDADSLKESSDKEIKMNETGQSDSNASVEDNKESSEIDAKDNDNQILDVTTVNDDSTKVIISFEIEIHESDEKDKEIGAKNGQVESVKEACDKDKTEELLEQLPLKLESLMKEEFVNGNACGDANGQTCTKINTTEIDEKGDCMHVGSDAK